MGLVNGATASLRGARASPYLMQSPLVTFPMPGRRGDELQAKGN